MGNNTMVNKKKTEQSEPSPYWLEMFFVLSICVAFAGVTIYVINVNKEIATFDKAIADIETTIENNKTIIENLKKQQERLKTEKVLAFARKYNMMTPMQGQICMVDPHDLMPREQSPYMYAKRQSQGAAVNVATVQKNP